VRRPQNPTHRRSEIRPWQHPRPPDSNFGAAARDGPCPPAGSGTHHRRITIPALRAGAVALSADEKASNVEAASAKAALVEASLTGFVES